MDFNIGSDNWNGLSKLIEECGEVVQVAGKIVGTGGNVNHWDGTDLKVRLENELGDLKAAIKYISTVNKLNHDRINTQAEKKLITFKRWNKEQKERA